MSFFQIGTVLGLLVMVLGMAVTMWKLEVNTFGEIFDETVFQMLFGAFVAGIVTILAWPVILGVVILLVISYFLSKLIKSTMEGRND